ncbi:MAG TPA: peptidoglycan DD-metalloendopeptidase family protein [Thermoanaerobaculia bacterium]|jgi:murein DD-endopeptidase MepM/ murein hydrolase activator NlpD|nr:peptidoglycan DD-metalloendopeptidase family protein [Thermoanaerobaculia bacterium]
MKRPFAIGESLRRLARRPRVYVAVALPLAIPLILAAVTNNDVLTQPSTSFASAAMIAPPLHYGDLTVPTPATLAEHSVVLTLEEGDTLDSVLLAGGLGRSDAAALNNEFGKTVDLRRLRPGHLLRFHYDASGSVDSVEMKVNGWGEIDALRGSTGFAITPHEARQTEAETIVAAQIDSSLYEAVRKAGEGPQLVQELVDVFQWDIDFFALQKGDSFSLVAKKRFAGADLVGYGPIVAARFVHGSQTYEAFRSETPDGRAGYYARNGSPLHKQFLRAPLQFSRITSKFSKSRYHPLLHIFRPHHGVDYGAPVGTPVMTTADGVVMAATYNHGEGNYVRIRHSARIETSYLHLSRFAKGIKPGKSVTQGEVIGYVGATGLATGPHLDYRVSDNGTWLDPLQLKSITSDPLRGDALTAFRGSIANLGSKLATPAQQLAAFATKRRALF